MFPGTHLCFPAYFFSLHEGHDPWHTLYLNPGVNFTNILCAAFAYVRCASSFFVPTFRFVLYWCKPTGAKAARGTLMKLSPGPKSYFSLHCECLLYCKYTTHFGKIKFTINKQKTFLPWFEMKIRLAFVKWIMQFVHVFLPRL
jgi:hypothetical protein